MVEHYFYKPADEPVSDRMILPERETHHALHVLRVKPDERAWVLDGQGTRYLCRAHHLAIECAESPSGRSRRNSVWLRNGCINNNRRKAHGLAAQIL